MQSLKGFQKKYLREIAHGLKPVVIIGHKGITDPLIQSINESLTAHELIKIKFIDFKEKAQKEALIATIVTQSQCDLIGLTGHVAILFRQNKDPEKRKITIPIK